jgi:hypothetical protein
MPTVNTATIIARGMFTVGEWVSSPSTAAPSNPAKPRNANTLARAIFEKPTCAGENGWAEKPCAAPWAAM